MLQLCPVARVSLSAVAPADAPALLLAPGPARRRSSAAGRNVSSSTSEQTQGAFRTNGPKTFSLCDDRWVPGQGSRLLCTGLPRAPQPHIPRAARRQPACIWAEPPQRLLPPRAAQQALHATPRRPLKVARVFPRTQPALAAAASARQCAVLTPFLPFATRAARPSTSRRGTYLRITEVVGSMNERSSIVVPAEVLQEFYLTLVRARDAPRGHLRAARHA